MRKSSIFTAALAGLFFFFAGTFGAQAEEKSELTIKVNGIRSDKGNIMLALSKTFDWTQMNFIRTDLQKSSPTGTEFILKDLPLGEKVYIFVMHDENGNMRMDVTENGLPSEGFVQGEGEGHYIPSVVITGGKQVKELTMTYLFDK